MGTVPQEKEFNLDQVQNLNGNRENNEYDIEKKFAELERNIMNAISNQYSEIRRLINKNTIRIDQMANIMFEDAEQQHPK